MANELKTGFTGTPTEPPTGARKVARSATDAVSREATAAAVGAADHPYTATSIVLAIGTLAFTAGYLMGRSSAPQGYHYWR
ncbi:hypothetical protein EV132_11372 [Rhizobium sullae]|uniref:Uncharacterized protein n=1 Tax=Rhizobium sullae TaxID=50338 RepID=A0A4R3PWV0_RHISU|nr:hypothetical protein [Rhizobium sullae]TCU13088.1 hypothetical protein EV132_11372 [Rhizobium sullae]